MINESPRRWWTVSEAAAYIGISVKGAYDMAAAGKLPAARIGRLVRIDGQALEAALDAQVQGTSPAVCAKGRVK